MKQLTERPERPVLYGVVVPFLGVVTFIAGWWGIVAAFHVRSFFVPSPLDVVRAARELPVHIWYTETWVTLSEALTGYGLAAVGGLALALILTSSRILERATMPLLVAANSIPKVVLAPLLLIWMGFGQTPKVVMAILLCFFPILISSMSGLTSTPADLGELARSLSGSRWKTFLKVRLPWALPQVFVGLKVAISLAVIGAVVAELQGGSHGLGYMVVSTGQQANTALAFVSVVLLAIMAVVLYYAVVGIERLLLPWVRETSA
jgi:NitT/TauT family transport system permease protein